MTALKNNRGFTLLEIIIGVTILTGMCLLLYSTMNRVLSAKVKVEHRDEGLHGVRVALSKMVDDISGAIMANKVFSGLESSYITGLKGSDSSLIFSTLGHYHFLEGAKETDQTVIGYELKSAERGFYTLVRSDSGKLSDKLEESGVAYPMLEHVKSLKFSYYNSNTREWGNEWDSTQLANVGRLPQAIKIEVTVLELVDEDDRNPKEHEYSTMALIDGYKNVFNF